MTRFRRMAVVVVIATMLVTATVVPVVPSTGFATLLGTDTGVSGEYAELERSGAMASSLAFSRPGSSGAAAAADADADGELELAFDESAATPSDQPPGVSVSRRAVRITNRGPRPVGVSVGTSEPPVRYLATTDGRVTSFLTADSVTLAPGQTMTLGTIVRADALNRGDPLPTRIPVSAVPVEA